MSHKFIYVALIVALLGSCAPAERKKDGGESTKTATVTRGNMRISVESTGRVVPNQEVEIKCKASGEIITLPVDVSQNVTKGELLVQLDPIDEQRNVMRSEVNLAVSEAQLAQAELALKAALREHQSERERVKTALRSAVVNAEDASLRLMRQKKLYEKNIASEEELGAAKAKDAQAAATLQNALSSEKDLEVSQIQLESKRHNVVIATQKVKADKIALNTSKKRLADTTVNSPIDGVVVSRNVQEGQIIASGVSNVGGGTSVLVLADFSRIYVLVYVDESDIGQINVGQTASITADAFPEQKFAGKIVRVAPKGSVNSNVVTFEVKVEVLGANKNLLKPEMTANVEIIVLNKENILLLPISAVQIRGAEGLVTLKDKTSKKVTLGKNDGMNIEIISGLKEGDVVTFADKQAAARWRKEASNAARNKRRASYMQRKMLSGGKK